MGIYLYSTFGSVKVSGSYKLNIPIQGTPLNVKHTIADNNTADFGYSNVGLFYPSYYFLPGSQMSGFTTTLPSYYSSLDNDSVTPTNSTINDVTKGIKINKYNDFTNEWIGVETDFSCPYGYTYSAETPTLNHRCYIIKEPIEGGSLMSLSVTFNRIPIPEWPATQMTMEYYSRRYSNSISIVPSNLINNNIVMRSDRLPTSTTVFEPGGGNLNSHLLHANPIFSIYPIDDDNLGETGVSIDNEFAGGITEISVTGTAADPSLASLQGATLPTMDDGKHAGVISVGGLLLAKIPNETVEERNAYFRQRAQEQLHAVDNEMMRENAHSSMRIQSPERSSRTTFRQSNS